MGLAVDMVAAVGWCGGSFIGFLRDQHEQMFSSLLYHKKRLLVQNYVLLGKIGGILMLRTRMGRMNGLGTTMGAILVCSGDFSRFLDG
jgi:hypothetical protein